MKQVPYWGPLLGNTVQNLVARVTRLPGFVYAWSHIHDLENLRPKLMMRYLIICTP